MNYSMLINKIAVVSDVDGVLTDGMHYYTKDGKKMKAFGRDDRDGVRLFKRITNDLGIGCQFCFTTDDKIGFDITKARLESWERYNARLFQHNQQQRCDLINQLKTNGWYVIYIGDSFVDVMPSLLANYVGVPYDGWLSKNYIEEINNIIISKCYGGHGALADILMHFLFSKFSEFDINKKYKTLYTSSYPTFVTKILEKFN